MTMNTNNFFTGYANRLSKILTEANWQGVGALAAEMERCWRDRSQVFICGNGGSAGNAVHLANDFLYGIAKRTGGGMRVHALPANAAVLTCLANDVGYDNIFSEQLAVMGNQGDLLIALSGSGNSSNIVAALQQAKAQGIKSCAILGYTGGKCKELADIPIHFPVDDMQQSEDMQVIVGHMLMQWMYERRSAMLEAQ